MSLEHLILLRHGETDWNAEFRMQGHCDIPLSGTGLEQAAAAAPSIAALAPDVIVSSDLRRAKDTAHEMAAATGLPVTSDARLRETSLGQWEGLTRQEVSARWPETWDEWRHTSAVVAPPGGESRIDVARRALPVVDELAGGRDRRALLVTHGGLIVGLTGLLLGLPHRHWVSLVGVANCHWVVLRRGGGRWAMRTYNGGLAGIVIQREDDEIGGD
jgi:2,3-bisphosphoglycerate-dependent phosphoglycerate mutase/probable phosphoglycerate mutase